MRSRELAWEASQGHGDSHPRAGQVGVLPRKLQEPQKMSRTDLDYLA